MTSLNIPTEIILMGNNVAGVIYEIVPRLTKEIKSQIILDTFGINMMDTIGDYYTSPICGSVMWLIYKNYCGKNLEKFIECVDTEEKQHKMRMWIMDNYTF